jgi:effector-binding domain-containing protein
MNYKCEIYDQPAQRVVSIRTRSSVEDLPRVMGESYAAIGQYLGGLGEMPSGAPFAAYHNMDVQDLDIEIGFPVSHTIPGKANIQATEMPAGKYASCLHKGPYAELAPAYEALTKFVNEHNLLTTGIAYEFYLNAPDEVPQEDLRTQIVFQLAS